MELSRRELISTFLGVAVANAACKRNKPRAIVPGALIDRVSETGHLLRGAPLPRAAAASRTLDAVIVGGGAAGLSAAWRLRGGGLDDFLVLEVDDAAGGTARSGKNEVSAFPWGAHYLPAPLTDQGPVPRLLKQMGALTGVDEHGAPKFAEQSLLREPEERLFYKGEWYEGLYLRAGASPDDLAQWKRFEAQMALFARAKDGKGRKAFDVPIARGSDDAEWTQLDKLTMAQWLETQGYTSPRLKWQVDYACRDDYGTTSDGVSAWAGIWYFCSRQTGDDRSDGYLSWPEGNGRLISELSASTGAERLKTQWLVHTLERDDAGWNVHVFDAATKQPVWLKARQVVLACPRFVAARVLADWRKAPPDFVKEFQIGPWAVANVTLDAHPRSRGFPLCWDNVFYESKSLGYVVATHQAPRADEHGPTVLTWYYPLTGEPVAERTRLLGTKYEDWEALVMADLSPAHYGFDAMVKRIEVMRWGHAMIRPRPGFLWGGARQKAQESLEGLHFAHTELGGLALFEEANHFGVSAAEKVLAGLGRTAGSWL
ncbi:MAG: FAD-dependent oxidoreductase [Myxococcaceae bacterium]